MSSMPENAALVLPWLARGRAVASQTNFDDAIRWLNENRQPRAARVMQKAEVGASATTDSDVAAMIGAWTSSMSTASIFFKLLNENFFRKLPMHQRIALATSSPTAGLVAEGMPIPVSRVVISSTTLQPVTVASMLVTTREMLLDPAAEGLFNRELKIVLGQAVDAALLGVLSDGSTAVTIPSSGAAEADAVADVRSALLALGPVGEGSRLAWILSADVARKGSALGTSGGGTFPGLGPSGGEIRGVVALVSNGVPAGQAVLLDCAQIGAAAGAVDVLTSNQADVEMSDAPSHNSITPTGGSLVSMWQSNSVVMKATATIAASRLNDSGAVLLEGIDWGGA